MKISVVMPVYNERATLRQVVELGLAVPLEIELLCVDDGSMTAHAKSFPSYRLKIHGFEFCFSPATWGRVRLCTVVFAKRREISSSSRMPAEYTVLLEPLIEGRADVVYGSRFLSARPHCVLHFWHSVGNWILTLLSNPLTDINLSDMETGYKVFRREVSQSIPLREMRFGFEPEITVKIAKRSCVSTSFEFSACSVVQVPFRFAPTAGRAPR